MYLHIPTYTHIYPHIPTYTYVHIPTWLWPRPLTGTCFRCRGDLQTTRQHAVWALTPNATPPAVLMMMIMMRRETPNPGWAGESIHPARPEWMGARSRGGVPQDGIRQPTKSSRPELGGKKKPHARI